MKFRTNPSIAQVEAPPIAEAATWLRPGPRNRELVNLCQAVPGYPPADELQAEVARLSALPSSSQYTDILGTPELRQALALHMAADYRGSVEPEQVAITAGCNQAFAAAMMLLAGPGDNVVLPVPWYFNHRMWLDMLRIDTRIVPGLPLPRIEDIDTAIDQNTRAIALCSPNNPTGAIYPPELIGAIYDLAKARGIALVIDETYKDFRGIDAPAHDLFTRPDWPSTLIQLFSFSKILAITGYRVGSMTAGSAVIAEAEKILDCVAICAPALSQGAALFGIEGLHAWKAEKAATMARRSSALRGAFANPSLHYDLMSAGAFFAYIRHPFRGRPAKEVARRLAAEHDLLCLPGSMFGPGQEDYLRLAYANVAPEIMPEAVARLIESQEKTGAAPP